MFIINNQITYEQQDDEFEIKLIRISIVIKKKMGRPLKAKILIPSIARSFPMVEWCF